MRVLTESEIKELEKNNKIIGNDKIYEFICPYCGIHELRVDFENDKNIECTQCDYIML